MRADYALFLPRLSLSVAALSQPVSASTGRSLRLGCCLVSMGSTVDSESFEVAMRRTPHCYGNLL